VSYTLRPQDPGPGCCVSLPPSRDQERELCHVLSLADGTAGTAGTSKASACCSAGLSKASRAKAVHCVPCTAAGKGRRTLRRYSCEAWGGVLGIQKVLRELALSNLLSPAEEVQPTDALFSIRARVSALSSMMLLTCVRRR
jgi:hypothetical protein